LVDCAIDGIELRDPTGMELGRLLGDKLGAAAAVDPPVALSLGNNDRDAFGAVLYCWAVTWSG